MALEKKQFQLEGIAFSNSSRRSSRQCPEGNAGKAFRTENGHALPAEDFFELFPQI
jgi:hypothetical protein